MCEPEFGKRTPDQQIVMKLGKDESLRKQGPGVQGKMLAVKDMLGQGDKRRYAFIHTVLDMCIGS